MKNPWGPWGFAINSKLLWALKIKSALWVRAVFQCCIKVSRFVLPLCMEYASFWTSINGTKLSPAYSLQGGCCKMQIMNHRTQAGVHQVLAADVL